MRSRPEDIALEELASIAIVGRPNVGKSTLFNKIAGRRRALVDNQPGVTRDRIEARATWNDRTVRLVDTGGFDGGSVDRLEARVHEQSRRAIEEADVVILVVDGRAGVVAADIEAAEVLQRGGKATVVAVNKIDSQGQEALVGEFFSLGLGEPIGVSAEHSRGLDDLLDRAFAMLASEAGKTERIAPVALRLALIGRPNAGKSSLLNRLVGDERVIVDATPGTTRDPVDVALDLPEGRVVFVDTAGIRRRSRIDLMLERATVARALDSVARADVALLVVDAAEGITDQDARLARAVWDLGRGLLVVFNKWDLLPREGRSPEDMVRRAREDYAHLRPVPFVFVSALRGTRIDDVLPAARRVREAHRTELSTRLLNDLLRDSVAALEPPLVAGRRARFYYVTSLGTAPPTVGCFVNARDRVTEAYMRYLENRLREAVPLEGTPVRFRLRERSRDALRKHGAEPASAKAR